MKPAELTLTILGIVQVSLLIWTITLLRRAKRDPVRTPDHEALARSLEGPFKRLAAEWDSEHKRLAQQTQNAADLVARLTRLQFQAHVPASDTEPAVEPGDQPSSGARQEARRRLLAGEDAADVAEATGLPDGEVRVLASVLKRGG